MQGKFHSRTERTLEVLRTVLAEQIDVGAVQHPDRLAHVRLTSPAYRVGLFLQTLMCHYGKADGATAVTLAAAAATAAAAGAAGWAACAVALDWLLRWVLGHRGDRIQGAVRPPRH